MGPGKHNDKQRNKEKEDTHGNEHEVPKTGLKTKEQEASCSKGPLFFTYPIKFIRPTALVLKLSSPCCPVAALTFPCVGSPLFIHRFSIS